MRELNITGNDNIYSHAYLADVYISASMYEKAQTEIEHLPYSRYGKARMMGNLRIREKRYDEALEFYRESISDALNWLMWDIERSAQCHYKIDKDNANAIKILKLEYDLIHLLYDGNMHPIPLSFNLMYVNMQLAANCARTDNNSDALMHIEEILNLNEAYNHNCGINFDTGCILYPKAMQPFNKVYKKQNYKKWILRCLEWNSFDSLREQEQFIILKERIENL